MTTMTAASTDTAGPGPGGPGVSPWDLAAALAAMPRRRDFAISQDLRRSAWVTDEAIEWWETGEECDTGVAGVSRFPLRAPLPLDTDLVLVDDLIGVCRATDAGVEIAYIDTAGRTADRIAALATPRTCLLPRLPGARWQLLAVHTFDGRTVLCRIDWPARALEAIVALPAGLTGGAWLDPDGRRLAGNLVDPTGRTGIYRIDLPSGAMEPLFDEPSDSEDRALLYDPESDVLAVATNAPGYVALALARRGTLQLLPRLEEGDEAGGPLAFLSTPGATSGPARRQLLVRHDEGAHSRLRLVDLDHHTYSEPLPVPDGEIGLPVVVQGQELRFPYSAPDVPWRIARLDLGADPPVFGLDPEPGPEPTRAGPPLMPGWSTTFTGPAGPMSAVVVEPAAVARPPGARVPDDLAVVALHGGPFARWGSAFNPEFQLFAHLGLPVYGLDYPGSTGSGQALVTALLGQGGIVDVAAVSAVCDVIEAKTGRRVLLYGESYGAFLALSTAAVRHCAGVVAFAPFASFHSLSAAGSPAVRETLELLNPEISAENGRNPGEWCRNIRSKVLIAHGTADKTIPVEQSQALVAALQGRSDAGEDGVNFVELEGQEHELTDRHALERWYREIVHFLGGLPASRSPAQRETPAAGALSRRPRQHQTGRR
jgi:dienelactone hydrolase